MRPDSTTLKDLSVFANNGEDIFHLLDYTVTQAGKDVLRQHLLTPPDTAEELQQVQHVVKFFAANPDAWTPVITNGTLVMLEKFFESADNADTPPLGLSLLLGSFMHKLLNRNQYFFTQFSLSHLSDFLKGCTELVTILQQPGVPVLLQRELKAIQNELQHRLANDIITINSTTPYTRLVTLSYHARRDMKNMVYRLANHFARLDAWRSMALATIQHGWVFPELLPAKPVCFEAKAIYHPLLQKPIPYDIAFNQEHNFLLLTGANMSGKTTFMRALGVSALLAHLGTGVPAASMRISFLQGIITNMYVEDNLVLGESYFFAEVQRIKQTALRLQQHHPHLVLMDELFKGTNVHDAHECTRAIVEGLLHHPEHIMVLSTHLYEVAQHFSTRSEILFAYFVTTMTDGGNYHFTYELKQGISDDRIGYRILQKEGVLNLLKPNS